MWFLFLNMGTLHPATRLARRIPLCCWTYQELMLLCSLGRRVIGNRNLAPGAAADAEAAAVRQRRRSSSTCGSSRCGSSRWRIHAGGKLGHMEVNMHREHHCQGHRMRRRQVTEQERLRPPNGMPGGALGTSDAAGGWVHCRGTRGSGWRDARWEAWAGGTATPVHISTACATAV